MLTNKEVMATINRSKEVISKVDISTTFHKFYRTLEEEANKYTGIEVSRTDDANIWIDISEEISIALVNALISRTAREVVEILTDAINKHPVVKEKLIAWEKAFNANFLKEEAVDEEMLQIDISKCEDSLYNLNHTIKRMQKESNYSTGLIENVDKIKRQLGTVEECLNGMFEDIELFYKDYPQIQEEYRTSYRRLVNQKWKTVNDLKEIFEHELYL
jgi:hypothetical protein